MLQLSQESCALDLGVSAVFFTDFFAGWGVAVWAPFLPSEKVGTKHFSIKKKKQKSCTEMVVHNFMIKVSDPKCY